MEMYQKVSLSVLSRGIEGFPTPVRSHKLTKKYIERRRCDSNCERVEWTGLDTVIYLLKPNIVERK
jgi:hypothetical protein